MKKIIFGLGLSFLYLLGIGIYFIYEQVNAETAKIRVACIGDSITFGHGLASPHTESYPAHLQTLLGDAYEVRNFGNSGRGILLNSRRGNGWRAYMKQKSFQDAIDFKPDIVICNLGINDDLEWIKGPEKRAQFIQDYATLIQAFQTLPSQPKFFMWTRLAPIMKGHRSYYSESTASAFRMREDLEQVAKQNHVVGIDMFSPMYGVDSLFLPDGIHPNSQGAEVIAQATYRQIAPWLSPAGKFIFPWYIGDNMVKTPSYGTLICGVAPHIGKVTAQWEKSPHKVLETFTDSFGRFHLSEAAEHIFCDSLLVTCNGTDTTWIRNIQIGELFLAVGQSNMLFRVNQSTRSQTAYKELSESAKHKVRILNRIPTFNTSPKPWDPEKIPNLENSDSYFNGHWDTLSKKNIPEMSAVSFEFATRRHAKTQTPIGVITISVGGAPMESFMSETALFSNRKLDRYFQNEPKFVTPFLPHWAGKRLEENLSIYTAMKPQRNPYPLHYYLPAMIFETQLKNLSQLNFSGIIYYQGESNATESTMLAGCSPLENHTFMNTLLIQDYCRCFHVAPEHFLMVQLPQMNRDWKDYRAAQEKACQTTGARLCNIYDLGTLNDVHPPNKADVSERLTQLLPSTPLFEKNLEEKKSIHTRKEK